jgi:hypothetical protein
MRAIALFCVLFAACSPTTSGFGCDCAPGFRLSPGATTCQCEPIPDVASSQDTTADTGAMCLADLSSGPSPRGESFGGFGGGSLLTLSGDEGVAQNCNPAPKPVADGWTFTPCVGWSSVDASNAPSPRARAVSTSDGGSNVWVFGGRWRTASSGNYTLRNDTWQWSKASGWAQIDDGSTGGPKGRSSAVLGIDPTTGFLWLHGGNASNNGLAFTPLSDVWFFDPAFGGWQLMKTTGKAPVARIMHAGTVTRDGKWLVLFGGGDANAFQGPFFSDTWRMDLQTGAWEEIATSGSKPAARILGSMVASGGSKVLLFGGHDGGDVGNRNDIWQLDVDAGTWTVLRKGDLGKGGDPDVLFKPANAACDFPADFMQLDLDSPERRESALLSWDDAGQKAWLFGGKGDCGPLRDVWTFDPGSSKWQVVDDTPKGWSCLRYVTPCGHLCGG